MQAEKEEEERVALEAAKVQAEKEEEERVAFEAARVQAEKEEEERVAVEAARVQAEKEEEERAADEERRAAETEAARLQEVVRVAAEEQRKEDMAKMRQLILSMSSLTAFFAVYMGAFVIFGMVPGVVIGHAHAIRGNPGQRAPAVLAMAAFVFLGYFM